MVSHLKAIDSPHVEDISAGKIYQQVDRKLRNRFVNRVKSTRLFQQVLRFEPLLKSYCCPSPLLEKIKQAEPDVLMTVAHGVSAFVAQSASQKLNIPLVSFFHDWWPFVDQRLVGLKRPRYASYEAKFRELYRESKIAFCVSEGMRNRLGGHPDNPLMYPMLDRLEPPVTSQSAEPNFNSKLVYTGDMGHQYGRMIRSLIDTTPKLDKDCALSAFGHVGGWPKATLADCVKARIVNLNQPFQQVFNSMCQSRALLVVASFEEQDRIYSETSFPSKIIYYAMAGRPIIFWGPKYSSVYEFGSKTNAGLVIDSPDPAKVWEAFEAISSDDNLFGDLSDRCRDAYENHFQRDKLQKMFLDGLQRSVGHRTSALKESESR